jgi:hypothetical protein
MRRIILLTLVLFTIPVHAGEPPAIGTREGQMHPDFALPDLDGNPRRLSDWRGKRVLLLHFASW